MFDIAVALLVGGVAGLVVGTTDAKAGAAAFGAAFTAVFAALDRRRARIEQRQDGQREAELERLLQRLQGQAPVPEASPASEVTMPAPASSSQPAAVPAPLPALADAQEELTAIHLRQGLPLVDWPRTASSITVLFVFVIGTVGAFGFLIGESGLEEELIDLVGYSVLLVLAAAFLGLGFWLGRTSRSSGFLGSAIMGTVVSVSIPIVGTLIDLFEGSGLAIQHLQLTAMFTVAGTLLPA